MPKLTFDELDRFTNELASLSRANLPLPEGLRQLAATLRPGRLRVFSEQVAAALERGRGLSEALAEASISVPRQFVALMQCAELSGDYGAVLRFAVQHGRRIRRHRVAVFTAMLYPATVVAVAVGVVLLLSFLVLPHFKEIYEQLGAELPMMTHWLLNMAAFVQNPVVSALLALLAAVFALMLATAAGRRILVDLVSWLPGFHSLVGLSDTAVFTKFVGLMVQKGAPLPLALQAAGLTVTSRGSRKSLERMAAAAERGLPVSPQLASSVPSVAAYLFTRGEESGEIAGACLGIADYCEDRFDRLSQRALGAFEPLLLAIIAGFVGISVVSLYLPLFAIPKLVR